MALDHRPLVQGIDPEGDQVRRPRGTITGAEPEQKVPWIGRKASASPITCGEGLRPIPGRQVTPHRVDLIAVDPPLSLLQFYRIVGQVPVDYGVAVRVEVQALLPDGGGYQDERSARRAEGEGESLFF